MTTDKTDSGDGVNERVTDHEPVAVTGTLRVCKCGRLESDHGNERGMKCENHPDRLAEAGVYGGPGKIVGRCKECYGGSYDDGEA